jgi:rRNA maturation endonuclease Nob1
MKRTNIRCRRCGVSYETALPSSPGRWTDRCEFCGGQTRAQGARDRATSTSRLPGPTKLLRG